MKDPIIFDNGIPSKLSAEQIAELVQKEQLIQSLPASLREQLVDCDSVDRLINSLSRIRNKVYLATNNPNILNKEWAARFSFETNDYNVQNAASMPKLVRFRDNKEKYGMLRFVKRQREVEMRGVFQLLVDYTTSYRIEEYYQAYMVQLHVVKKNKEKSYRLLDVGANNCMLVGTNPTEFYSAMVGYQHEKRLNPYETIERVNSMPETRDKISRVVEDRSIQYEDIQKAILPLILSVW